ncbi:hypothetical protein AB0K18_45715 [Nonomuraea sp. NPDC049421]|uniref:hypothetical protein n=1 Tax=Nonomuraea sp. NPDC049421 TaxID=3155275 RepID=UPI0034290E6A
MTGKTVLITGATSGIGAHTARLLLDRGHRVPSPAATRPNSSPSSTRPANAALPHLETTGGRLVLIGSVTGLKNSPANLYSATK